MSSIYDWSLDAAANANADPLINWAEGQPPGSVNDSARVMMQRIAQYVRDQGGILLADGTENALSLSLHAPVSLYQEGIMVRFRARFANNGAVTVNINNLGSRPVFMTTPDGVVALAGGEIQAGGIYELVYSQSLSNGAGGWLLLTPTPTQVIPSGLVASFACEVAPSGWLECDGGEISRSLYANLFAAIGTLWGEGDGVTTFHLPDFRAQFLRGWDHGRGLDGGRVFASDQDSQNKNHNHGGFTSNSGNHTHNYTVNNFTNANVGSGPIASVMGRVEEVRTSQSAGVHQHQILSEGGLEARPRNSAILYAIKI